MDAKNLAIRVFSTAVKQDALRPIYKEIQSLYPDMRQNDDAFSDAFADFVERLIKWGDGSSVKFNSADLSTSEYQAVEDKLTEMLVEEFSG